MFSLLRAGECCDVHNALKERAFLQVILSCRLWSYGFCRHLVLLPDLGGTCRLHVKKEIDNPLEYAASETTKPQSVCEIACYHGGEYEVDRLLGCCTMSGRSLWTFLVFFSASTMRGTSPDYTAHPPRRQSSSQSVFSSLCNLRYYTTGCMFFFFS
jgi:hypothetical protein